MRKYFITSSGTGIGKTYITTMLCKNTANSRIIKPIISGWDEEESNDTLEIAKITGESIDEISPWRFSAPLSPDMAARLEGREIDFQELINFCNDQPESEYLFIEAVGGVMVPLNDKYTVIDWVKALNIPAILVVGSYLGSISHTLTAIASLQSRNIEIDSIIISESEDGVDLNELKITLQNFTNIKITILPRGGQVDLID